MLTINGNTYDAQWVQQNIGPLAYEEFLNSSLIDYGATVVESVNGRFAFATMDFDNSIGPLEACPTDFGSLAINQQREPVCTLALNKAVDHDVFVNSYFASSYRRGTQAKRATDVSDFTLGVTQAFLEGFFEGVHGFLVSGAEYNAALEAECPDSGLLTKLAADVPAANVVGSPVAITPDNVAQEINRLWLTLPIASRRAKGRKEPKFALAGNVYEALLQLYYNPTQTSGTGPSGTVAGVTWESGQPVRFNNLPFYVLDQLPDDSMFLTWPQNIVVAMDTRADLTRLEVRDLFETTLCRQVQMQIAASVGVAVQRFDQVATYGI